MSVFSSFCLMFHVHRGNWWGHAPYKHGTPCSSCPPSYGGGCKDNLCYKGKKKPQRERGRQKSMQMTPYHALISVLFKGKMTIHIHCKRKLKRTTLLNRRSPVPQIPELGPPDLSLPVSPLQPLHSPPQRTCRRMKWSTHSRCVSCHLTVYFGSSFVSKWGVYNMVLGLGGAESGSGGQYVLQKKKKPGSEPKSFRVAACSVLS